MTSYVVDPPYSRSCFLYNVCNKKLSEN